MCRRLLLSIVVAGLTVVLAGTVRAQLPTDPPVRQELGLPDVVAGDLEEPDCRLCHDEDDEQGTVPNRHHLLWNQPIPSGSIVPYPDADGDGNDDTTYGCLNCHDTSFDAAAVRDCTACHTSSPHHRTQAATDRQCSTCHGDFVDDYDDGHYIPTYSPSLVTPYTGLHGDGFYDGDRTRPEMENLGTGVLDIPPGNHDGNAAAGLILGSSGQNNDILIDHTSRGSTATFRVTVVHQVGIDPPTAVWSPGFNLEAGKLTITFDPGVTTANEMVDVINAATGTPPENSLDAELDHSEGEGTGLFPETHYEPEGGEPLNSRGFGAGSCSYCHDADDAPGGIIVDNHDTHHGIDLGIGTGSNVKAGTPDDPNPGGEWRKCNICHDYTGRGGTYHDNGGETFALHIRICEECHGPDTLHNIQGESPNAGSIGTVVVGGEDTGYGHVGRDAGPGDSDCWGCHGFPMGASASAPRSGPIVPAIYNADRKVIKAGTDALVILSGASFRNMADGVPFESEVVLTASDGSSVTLTPDAITDEGILVTIPGTTARGNYTVQAVKNGNVKSNPVAISIIPEVTISSATADGLVTIKGNGFGGYAKGSGTSVTTARTWGWGRWARTTAVEASVVSWNDTEIVANFGSAPKEVTVNSVFGSATAEAQSARQSRSRGPRATRSTTPDSGTETKPRNSLWRWWW
jgi:hypothetical protein